MATKRPIQVGDVVHCTFLDHAENSKDVMTFEVFGRISSKTRWAYQIRSWGYIDDRDRERDNNESNETWFSIVKKAIIDIRVLK